MEALAKAPDSVPSTHTHLKLWFQGIWCSLFISAGTRHIHDAHDCIHTCKILIHIRENNYKRENWSEMVIPEVCLWLCVSSLAALTSFKSLIEQNAKTPKGANDFLCWKSLLNRNQTLRVSSCSCQSLDPDHSHHHSHHQKTESRALTYLFKLNDRFRILSNWLLHEASILRAITSRREGI